MLFLFLQLSHGRSFRLRILLVPESADVELLMLVESRSLPFVVLVSIEGFSAREAMAMGAVRAIEVGVDMA